MQTFSNLGRQTPHKLSGADASLLEVVAMQFDATNQTVTIETDEFTSLCPATGGPDFGTITITYRPDKFLVESKSLKYYLESYRNEPIFHEAVVQKICDDLAYILQPQYLYVSGKFKPRGGLSIEAKSVYQPTEES